MPPMRHHTAQPAPRARMHACMRLCRRLLRARAPIPLKKQRRRRTSQPKTGASFSRWTGAPTGGRPAPPPPPRQPRCHTEQRLACAERAYGRVHACCAPPRPPPAPPACMPGVYLPTQQLHVHTAYASAQAARACGIACQRGGGGACFDEPLCPTHVKGLPPTTLCTAQRPAAVVATTRQRRQQRAH